jgi:parallel beta-helix repeat protein
MMRVKTACVMKQRAYWGLMLLNLLLTSLTSSVWATTYYVSQVAGSGDSNACTSPGAGACRTIRGGASKMSGGDTLLVQGGTYVEQMTYGTNFPWVSGTAVNNRTRYKRYQNERVIVQPSSTDQSDHLVATYQKKYIELDGFIFDGNNGVIAVVKFEDSTGMRLANSEVKNSNNVPSGNCVLITSNGNHEIVNNNVHNCVEYGLYHSGHNSLIDRNIFHDNGGYGIHVYADGGGVDNNTVSNNVLYENGFNSFFVSGRPAQFPAMIISRGNNNIGYNNIIYNNWDSVQLGEPNVKFYNNTIYNNAGSRSSLGCIYIYASAIGGDVRNNICYQNNSGNVIINNRSVATVQNNLVSGNPNFANPSGGDFHLTASSTLAIDQGFDLPGIVTTDIEGTVRPQGPHWDIGAYEFVTDVERRAAEDQ